MVLNSFAGVGRLAQDPITVKNPARYPEAKTGAQFVIAMNKFIWVEGELKKETVYLPCVAFNRLAEIVTEFLAKGSQVGVSGSLEMTRGVSLNGDNCESSIWVVVRDLELLFRPGGEHVINLDSIPQYKRPEDHRADKPSRKLRIDNEKT